jgi:uracil-DNA glycosylase
MRWTERQQAMLREMGVRLWARDVAAPAPVANDDEAVVVADEPRARVGLSSEGSARPAPSASPARPEVEWLPADWLIVGEPFDAAVGAAAATAAGDQERLLANMLQAIGVSRDAPARASRACHLALTDGTPGRLDAALERVAPRLILALGRAAAEALLDVDEPLGRLRGKVHERVGIRVVVSFPLAYLLRNPTEKAKAWADLCLAVRALEAVAS